MQAVINIPEDQWITLHAKSQDEIVAVVDHKILIDAIRNGIALPKGHGRLIDETGFNKYLISRDKDFQHMLSTLPTIVEADK